MHEEIAFKQKTVTDLKKKLMSLRFQKSMSQLPDTSQIRKTKREIARNNTHIKCIFDKLES